MAGKPSKRDNTGFLEAELQSFLAKSPEEMEIIAGEELQRLIRHLANRPAPVGKQTRTESPSTSRTTLPLDSEAHFQAVFNFANMGIAVLNTRGGFKQFNRRWEEMFDYPADELLGLTCQDIAHSKDSHAVRQKLTRLYAGRLDHFRVECRFVRKDGSIFWGDMSASPIRNPSGRVTAVICMIINISNRVSAEVQLTRRTHELGERIKKLNCLYGISRFREAPNQTPAAFLGNVVHLLPQAWQFPEIACAKIVFEGRSFKSADYVDTPWCQKQTLRVYGQSVGAVSVCYRKQTREIHEGPFHREERNLINAVAEVLGRTLEHYSAEESLKRLNQELEFRVKERTARVEKINRRLAQKIEAHERAVRDMIEVQTRYRGIFNNTTSGVAVYKAVDDGTDFILIDLNRAGEIIDKINGPEVLGKRILEIFPGMQDFGLLDVMRKVYAGSGPQHLPTTLYTDARHASWRKTTVYKLLSGEIVTVYSDETDRRRAEEALRQSEEMLAGITLALTDSLTMIDENYTIVWANEVAEDLFANRLIGRKCYQTMANQNSRCADCPLMKSFEDGQIREYESEVMGADGRMRYLWCTISVVATSDGRAPKLMIHVARNISEKRILQAEAMQAAHLASLGELAAGVAHEINNPINGIINYAQLLSDEIQLNPQTDVYTKGIIKEGRRIATIVKNLLSFAREEGQERSSVQVWSIVGDVLALTEKQFTKDGITIVSRPDNKLPPIKAKAQEIQQVFLNLFSNARYALNGKNAPGVEKRLEITTETVLSGETEYVRTNFMDNGIGIPKEIFEKICHPFYSTKPPGEGTGLGLSISHGIVKNHGGRLMFESKNGEYTKVMVDLPVAVNDDAPVD